VQVTVVNANRSQKKYTESLVHFCAYMLMSKRMTNSLEVTVRYTKDMYEKHNECGTCMWEDDNTRPKEFTIEIDKSQPLRKALESVCHEMVHVKQFATGQMKDLMKGRQYVKFDGVEYNRDKMSYWDYPWEIEAMGREIGLFVRWAEQNDLGHKAWAIE